MGGRCSRTSYRWWPSRSIDQASSSRFFTSMYGEDDGKLSATTHFISSFQSKFSIRISQCRTPAPWIALTARTKSNVHLYPSMPVDVLLLSRHSPPRTKASDARYKSQRRSNTLRPGQCCPGRFGCEPWSVVSR